jgi:RNA polymerase sigma-70 factor (ECF subfamily)
MYGLARRLAMRNVRPPSRVDSPIGASIIPVRSRDDAEARTWTAEELSASAAARMREVLEPEERMILVLRVDRQLSWEDIARVMENPPTAATLRECASRLRRYFHRTRDRLRELAMRQGLLPTSDTP